MKKIYLLIIFIGFSMIISSCIRNVEMVEDKNLNNENNNVLNKIPDKESLPKNQEKINSIQITDSGYVPDILTINQGDTVTFTNIETRGNWPASDIHPTHKSYPGSDIKKCGSVDSINIFDACKILIQGETYSFTFNEKGTWSYHDHTRSSMTGKIIVR